MARPSLCHTGFEFRRSPRALALAFAFQIQGKQGGTLQGDPELNLVVQVPSNNENPLTVVKQWHCRNVNQHKGEREEHVVFQFKLNIVIDVFYNGFMLRTIRFRLR